MKKLIALVFVLVCTIGLVGCGRQTPDRIKTTEGSLKIYYELSNGSWECEGHTYKYKLEIGGRMPNAAVDSTFIYLSNKETISLEQAYLAAGISSNMNDYFAVEDAVLVDMQTH